MVITLFYFSGTGNTWWCAEKMAEAFRSAGHDAAARSIEQLSPDETARLVGSSDLIGLGYPIFGSDLPQPMKDFINETLPPMQGSPKDIFVFCTQMMFSGDGGRIFENELADKGYTTRWSVHLKMPNNVCVTVLPFPYTTDQKKLDRILKRAEKRIHTFLQAVLSEKKVSQGKGWFSSFLGRLQRTPYRNYFSRLRNDISIDFEKCIRCYRCVDLCPSGNLIRQNDTIQTTGTCVLCLRCYNYCPVQAVLYTGKPHKRRRGTPYRGPVPGFKPEDLRRPR